MQYSAMPVRTVIERGPKGKRCVAFGIDWPGWSRGAKSPELALETLEDYRERYRPVAGLAGLASDFDAAGQLEIVEDRVGTGSTDFWGISFSPSSTEHGPMTDAELERGFTLLRACWTYFDGVAARSLPGAAQGPTRGRTRPRPDHPPHHSHRKRGFREAGRVAHSRGGSTDPRGTAAPSRCLPRGDARVQRRGGRAAHAVVDATIPPPALCLSHTRPCLGDGGQGPLRRGWSLTRAVAVRGVPRSGGSPGALGVPSPRKRRKQSGKLGARRSPPTRGSRLNRPSRQLLRALGTRMQRTGPRSRGAETASR